MSGAIGWVAGWCLAAAIVILTVATGPAEFLLFFSVPLLGFLVGRAADR